MQDPILPRRSVSAWLLFATTLVCYGLLFVDYPTLDSHVFFAPAVRVLFPLLVAFQISLAVMMFVVRSQVSYRRIYVFHAAVTIGSTFMFIYPQQTLLLWAIVTIVPACLYEDYPNGLIAASVVAVVLTLLSLLLYSRPLAEAGVQLLLMWAIALTLSVYTHQREDNIRLRAYIDQLEDNVTSLTRANYLSQDYAREVEEESRAAERRKMTRDIHDAVGYTLTNSIMMMEAAKVMLRAEPDRVGGYIESIRRNTENGLAEIKRILREVRARESPPPTVNWGMKRLIQVFATSTGTEVVEELGNTSWQALVTHSDCVYHFVQEALVNAFRHGRATRVTIMLWDHGPEIRVSVADNGVGSVATPQPNIGISGMVERAQAVGGRLMINNHVGGFEITLAVPKPTVAGGPTDGSARDA
jgi:signal transduction histidine kinase